MRKFLPLLYGALLPLAAIRSAETALNPTPFDPQRPKLDSLAVGEWWTKTPKEKNPPPAMLVPREEVIAFALYTQDHGVVKLTAQLFPLKPGESMEARLELDKTGDGKWTEAARTPIVYPGWSAHFRLENWDATKNVKYRVRHGEKAQFDGLIRKDPLDQDSVVVANMSCNSSRTTGLRPEIIDNLKAQNPDLLFFAGDQTYRHTEHTAGWIEFGLQFRDVMRDRPTVSIPDDHDVGHPNLWGENGRISTLQGMADGGYAFPASYVNMVQRQQSWHLPDPVDPGPVDQGITVYFTRLRLGGIDFAILEDRKFKSGPAGKIPKMGPRPDHINDPKYDPKTIDLPGLELLGKRQMQFLRSWGNDWSGAEIKVVLSQTAFCGAVHMHGGINDRLLADLDCNGWPQTGRRAALEEIRKVRALHLCGDQHLAVVVKHGIDSFGDGPYAFTSPALVNTIYGRWWHPEDEKPGPNPVPASPLPWTGDFLDGLGNKISMLAYANPPDVSKEQQRGDGYGIVRLHRTTRQATIECWPRFSKPAAGDKGQFPGWPVKISLDANDGRKPTAWLPKLEFGSLKNPVVQVISEQDGNILYTTRIKGTSYQPAVFSPGRYTIKAGPNGPGEVELKNIDAKAAPADAGQQRIP
jgi:3',5'-cyclic AMP phosphodiesterase CpdA